MGSLARRSGLGLAAFVLWIAGGPIEAQESPQVVFEEELEITEVLLDVLVTDKADQVIIGLGKDDFLVKENGKDVELTGVVFYSSRELLGSKEALERYGLSVDEVTEERYFIVLIQQQRSVAGEVPGILSRQMEAARDLETWIAQDLQPGDLVAVATFESRLEITQDFTSNLQDLRQAVHSAAQGQGQPQNWPSRQPAEVSGPSLLRHMPTGKELGNATKDIYEALQVIARAAGSIRGRKNLIFFGRGVGQMNRMGRWEPDSRFYRPTVEALNDNNVAMYPLSLMPQGSRHSLEDSLSSLASDTGGTFHRLFTSFTIPLEMIATENGGYYLLSFQSRRPAGKTGYQKVKIKTRSPELVVRGRQGYRFGD